MASLYEISVEAQNDLFEIWQRIAVDSVDLANRIEDEFHALFASLVRMPGQGHVRKDLTTKAVLFFPLYALAPDRFANAGGDAKPGDGGPPRSWVLHFVGSKDARNHPRHVNRAYRDGATREGVVMPPLGPGLR